MARDSSGTKNQPQYAGTGAPADAADMSEIANYAALVGNRKIGPSSARTTATGADVWEGLEWWDTTLNTVFVMQSGTWRASGTGLVPVIPASVAGTGVVLNPGGSITFTGTSSFAAVGFATTDFPHYMALLDVTASSANTTLAAQLRTGGSNDTSANYDTKLNADNAAPVTTIGGVSFPLSASATLFHSVSIDLFNWPLALRKKINARGQDWTNGGAPTEFRVAAAHRLTAAVDSLLVAATGGTITGSLTIFGYVSR